MKTSPTAIHKAVRTIGPNGIAQQFIRADATEREISNDAAWVYQIAEWRGVGIYKIHGESRKSYRQAFEAAGIYEDNRGARV
jgi:hypothetical protein